jgi:hypothetical protein
MLEHGDVARYRPVLKIIDKVKLADFSSDPVNVIEKIEGQISKAYGGRRVLSATTKFLWFKVRSPIIIYDSQVRKALQTPDGDLQCFYDIWRDKYNYHNKAIAQACASLSKVSRYACDQTLATPPYVQSISAESWFRQRVFDVYLWHKGQ